MNIFLLIIIYNAVEEVIKITNCEQKWKNSNEFVAFGINKPNSYIIFGKFIAFMIH